jgi:hypothetical protein
MNTVGATAVTIPRMRAVADGSVVVPSVRALRPAMTPASTVTSQPPRTVTPVAV